MEEDFRRETYLTHIVAGESQQKRGKHNLTIVFSDDSLGLKLSSDFDVTRECITACV